MTEVVGQPDVTPPNVAPVSTSSTQEMMDDAKDAVESEVDDGQIEMLLSEKLKQGYTLMESLCPACSTPLVRSNNAMGQHQHQQQQHQHFIDLSQGDPEKFPILVPSQSFEQPFQPVVGVPFCVSCTAHVVTGGKDVDALEQCDSLKDKGSILVALQDTQDDEDEDDDEDEEEENEPFDEKKEEHEVGMMHNNNNNNEHEFQTKQAVEEQETAQQEVEVAVEEHEQMEQQLEEEHEQMEQQLEEEHEQMEQQLEEDQQMEQQQLEKEEQDKYQQPVNDDDDDDDETRSMPKPLATATLGAIDQIEDETAVVIPSISSKPDLVAAAAAQEEDQELVLIHNQQTNQHDGEAAAFSTQVAAAFLCGSTASRQMVSPSPVGENSIGGDAITKKTPSILDQAEDEEETEEDNKPETTTEDAPAPEEAPSDEPQDNAPVAIEPPPAEAPKEQDTAPAETQDREIQVSEEARDMIDASGVPAPEDEAIALALSRTLDRSIFDEPLEQGVEQDLATHEERMIRDGGHAVQEAVLPPKPQGSDLLATEEKEQATKEEQVKETLPEDVIQEYSVR